MVIMRTLKSKVHRLSYGGFDPNASARENADRYNTYRRTSGGGRGGKNSGNGKGGSALILILILLLLAFLNMCVSNR